LNRGSAVADRPRNAFCLSVLSFNSMIRRVQSFIVSYFGVRFTNTYNYILCLLVRRTHKMQCTVDKWHQLRFDGGCVSWGWSSLTCAENIARLSRQG